MIQKLSSVTSPPAPTPPLAEIRTVWQGDIEGRECRVLYKPAGFATTHPHPQIAVEGLYNLPRHDGGCCQHWICGGKLLDDRERALALAAALNSLMGGA